MQRKILESNAQKGSQWLYLEMCEFFFFFFLFPYCHNRLVPNRKRSTSRLYIVTLLI